MSNQLQILAQKLAPRFGGDASAAFHALNSLIQSQGNVAFPEWTTAMKGGDYQPLLAMLQRAGRLDNTEADSFARGLGAFGEGARRAFSGKTGYVDPGSVSPPSKPGETFTAKIYVPLHNGGFTDEVNLTPADANGRRQYANQFWNVSAKGSNYGLGEAALFRLGAFAGDIVGNGIRQNLWNIHPAEVTEKLVGKFTLGDKARGYPQAEAYHFVDDPSRTPIKVKGSAEAALLSALGGFAGVEALNIGSGNYDPLNWQEGGRAKGFGALTAEEGGDPRVPTNPISDVVQRHFFGRKGRVLPWEEFTLERPDVSYEQYKKYRDWQYGKTDDDLIDDLTLGTAKFTREGLNGSPEFNMMGVSITPLGAAAAVGAALAARKANHHFGGKAFERFAELTKKYEANNITLDEIKELRRNPFEMAAYGDESRNIPSNPARIAQYKDMIERGVGRY